MNLKQKLTQEEGKIYDLAFKSKRLESINEDDRQKWTKAFLIKIHIITGWVIPERDELRMVVVDQFKKLLFENFDQLNSDEIEYAFRKYGTITEDWGKEINLNLISKALSSYLQSRQSVAEYVAQARIVAALPEKVWTDDDYDNLDRMSTESYYQLCLSTKMKTTINSLPSHKAILIKDGLMKEDEDVIGFFKKAISEGRTAIYKRD